MSTIAGLCFQALFGERPFIGADRSLDRKIATDAFGSGVPASDISQQTFKRPPRIGAPAMSAVSQ